MSEHSINLAQVPELAECVSQPITLEAKSFSQWNELGLQSPLRAHGLSKVIESRGRIKVENKLLRTRWLAPSQPRQGSHLESSMSSFVLAKDSPSLRQLIRSSSWGDLANIMVDWQATIAKTLQALTLSKHGDSTSTGREHQAGT